MGELIYASSAVLAAILAWDAWRRYLAHRAGDLRKDINDLRDVVGEQAVWINQKKQESMKLAQRPGGRLRR